MKPAVKSRPFFLSPVIFLVPFILVLPSATGSEPTSKERFDEGLLQEEVHQDLEKAIEHYSAIVATYDERRKLISTSFYRLAECLRKLGRMDEAEPLYVRIVAEFPERRDLVKLSQQYAPVGETDSTEFEEDRLPVLESSIMDHPEGLELLIDQLRESALETSMYSLAQLTGDLKASQLLNEFFDTQMGLENLKKRYTATHPRIRQQEVERDYYRDRMQGHVDWAIKFLSNRLNLMRKLSTLNSDQETFPRLRVIDTPMTLRAFIAELKDATAEVAVLMITAEMEQEGLSELIKTRESYQNEYSGKKILYGANHPEMRSIQARIESLNERISSHVLLVIEQLTRRLRILEQSSESAEVSVPVNP